MDNPGRAMGQAADAWWSTRADQPPTQVEAMVALDTICGPYRNFDDVEFEAEDPANPGFPHPEYGDYTDPAGPLGRLIAIAFEADKYEMSIGDAAVSPWAEGPEHRFRQHYGFDDSDDDDC